MRTREAVVDLVNSWIGKNEQDRTHREIIDIYNSYPNKARGIRMDYSWAWCASTWSALAVKLGYTDIMPIEISCGYLIERAKEMGCWVEDDAYIPKIGDAVLYDWNDSGIGDCTGWPEHVGTVVNVNKDAGYFVVTEGNYQDSVKKRTVSINGRFIRGFITPDYDDSGATNDSGRKTGLSLKEVAHEVIAGIWDTGEERKRLLEFFGYKYREVQDEVNRILNGEAATTTKPSQDQKQPFEKKVITTCYANYKSSKIAGEYKTTANLYCRNDAGSNKKSLCLIPKGNKVTCYGYFSTFNNQEWYLVQFVMDGVLYEGFCCCSYLTRC